MTLKNKTIIITGAGSGLGAEVARQFAAEGANLVLSDINDAALQEMTTELQQTNTRVATLAGSVADEAVCQNIVTSATDQFGGLDVLVNCAGIDPFSATNIVKTTEQQWDDVLAVNLRGPFLLSKYAIPIMQKAGSGSIVNVGSSYSLYPGPQEAAYSVSKAAILQLTKCTAIDFAKDNIRANCVCPGMMEGVMTDRMEEMTDDMIDARKEGAKNANPMGRAASYREVAEVILMLADNERSGMITGIAMPVDGGETA